MILSIDRFGRMKSENNIIIINNDIYIYVVLNVFAQ